MSQWILTQGTAVPTHTAPEGTLYWKTDTNDLYVNTNGSTGWQIIGGGSGSAPSGAAGGVLSGTYPNPGFAVDMATQAELDSEASTRSAADALLTPMTRTITPTLPLTGGGDLSANRTLDINNFGGDAGAGGTKGAVPAPAAGDAAAGKFLKASGAWAVPPDVDTGITQLTGDVTAGPGSGSQDATIANDAVTYAKMQNVSATDKVLGRATAGAGDVEEIACTAAGRALIDDADAAAQRTTLGLGTAAVADKVAAGAAGVLDATDATTTNARTPTAHAASHKSAGGDSIKLDELAAPTDVTTLNVSSTLHGLAPKSPADATQFLNGAATPAFAAVKDSDLSTSDIVTNDVSTTKHGFAPKAPNDATKYLDGTGAYSVPAGSGALTWAEMVNYIAMRL